MTDSMSFLEKLHHAHKERRRRFAMVARKHVTKTEPALLGVRYYYPRLGASGLAQMEATKAKKKNMVNKGLRLPNGALRHHTISNIKARVAKFTGLSISELEGRSRMRRTVYVRDRTIWLCVKYSKKSTAIIGKGFGGRDHGAIVNSKQKVEAAKNQKNVNSDGLIVVGDLTFHTKKAAAFYLFEKDESVENIALMISSSIRSVRTMRYEYITGKRSLKVKK